MCQAIVIGNTVAYYCAVGRVVGPVDERAVVGAVAAAADAASSSAASRRTSSQSTRARFVLGSKRLPASAMMPAPIATARRTDPTFAAPFRPLMVHLLQKPNESSK